MSKYTSKPITTPGSDRGRKQGWIPLSLLLAALSSTLVTGADKSGVGPNTISLPKGPGAIEGLGESFQPTLNTGTTKYGVSLKLPPGTAGQTPGLGLSYDGGGGNGPLGFGWSLPLAYVQRRSDQGIPTYGESVGFSRVDQFVSESREELVPQSDGFFFCKNESAFIRYRPVSNHWEGVSPDGTRLEFGLSDAGRIQNATSNQVFSWLLERQTDTRGNTILYSYAAFPGSNNLNQKYLTSISYGPGAPPWNNFHFVTFVYEDRPDWFEDCRSGFIVRTGKRLKEILIGTQGPTLTNHLAGDFNADGTPDYLNRKYALEYLNYAGTNSHWSLLAKVTQVGSDGVSTLPPATFGYDVSNPPDLLSATGQIIGGTNEPPFVMDNAAADFLDLNGDGLPDILRTEPGGGSHVAYFNRGEVSAPGAAIKWQSGVAVDSADGQAVLYNLQSTAPIAHLADMNGDGLADLAVTALDGDVFYFANQGNQVWGARQTMSAQDSAPPSPFGNAEVRTGDFDFDKRTDIIQSISSGGGADYRIWFNLGNQNYSASVTVSQNTGYLLSTPGVQIADFNGDRVPDITRIQSTVVTVTAGLGYGRFADPITVAIPDSGLDEPEIAKANLTDINGDGLADLVIERALPGQLWYWLNLGNYQFAQRKIINNMPTGVSGTAVIRWGDMNGNGSTDLVYADSSNEPRLQTVDIGRLVNGGETPNLLTAISNGIGRVTLIDYEASASFALADAAAGKPWPDLMPNPVQVVAAVTTLDSLGNQYTTQFRYHNGYYDPVEKQFRGFASVEQIEVGDPTAPTLVTRSHFDTGRAYETMKGRLLGLSVEQESGALFSSETNQWQLPPVTLYTGTNGTNVVFTHPIRSFSTVLELGQGTARQMESEFAYDRFGNQTTNANYGIVTNGIRTAFNDERISVTEYAINTNDWILRAPKRQLVMDENGALISRTENFYDDETFSGNNFGQVTIGNLTLSRAWINPTNASAFVKAARTKYDAYGNPIVLLDPLAVAGDFSQGHAREIGYDARLHSYPITETIHIGNGKPALFVSAAYDEGLSTVVSSTDFNNNTTRYGYDVFGRLLHIFKPLDEPGYPAVEYDYFLATPFGSHGIINYVETRQRDTFDVRAPKSKMYLYSRQYVDGLGRQLLAKQEAEPAAVGGTPRVVVNGAVQFNARQKPRLTLNPFFSQLGGDLNAQLAFENVTAPGWQGTFQVHSNLVSLSFASAHKSTVTYDATLRGVASTNQDGTFARTAYEPLLTRSYDENQADATSVFFGAAMVHHQDGLGRLIRTDEIVKINDDGTPAATPKTWTTRYEYDLNDRLTRIQDSQNNIKWLEYDGLKRKTFMNDPDRGVMTSLYDDASNLRETIDARGQHLVFDYDGANRLLSETYVGSSLSPRLGLDRGEGAVNVAYHYDAPAGLLDNGDGSQSTGQNLRGMLAFVSDNAGEEHTSYDARGRVGYAIKRIPDPQFLSLSATNGGEGQGEVVLVSYQTSFDYDFMDRVTRMVYPDNDEVSYSYNPRGLLERITGGPNGSIISNLVYAPSGQQRQIDYGNGVRTSYAYDPRLRLTTLLTASQPSTTNSQLINFGYEFDGVSNIKSITDLRSAATVPLTDKRRNTQTFAYDDLYRLTRATYNPSALNPQPSTNFIAYRYDRIGNMLAQTSEIAHFEKGLSVTDLGSMTYGGTLGATNRLGRTTADPGPHALSSITNPQSAIGNRQYPYDPNGNLTNIDGLECTWDFKDRLAAVEDDQMRAEYAYDFTGRRIIKRVWAKPGNNSPSTINSQPSTVLYIGKHFEVREHDAPTKYVFNGSTRIATITGSLSPNTRIQRFRFFPGWNLCSVAVTTSNTLQFLSGGASVPASLQSAYKWNSTIGNWQSALSNENLAAGSVLWIRASTNFTTSIVGNYTDPTNRPITTSATFLPSTGLEALPLFGERAGVRSDVPFSLFSSSSKFWNTRIPSLTNSITPDFLAAGAALFAQAAAPAELEVPDTALRIRYYHQDHLGSSSAMTDAQGALVEESAFYPFGVARTEYRLRGVEEAYKFTQKEKDRESGLHYFEARYLSVNLSRFSCPDPKYSLYMELGDDDLIKLLANPQMENLYAYGLGNPVGYTDPSGLEVRKTPTVPQATLSYLGIEDPSKDIAEIGQNMSKVLYHPSPDDSDATQLAGVGYNVFVAPFAVVGVGAATIAKQQILERMELLEATLGIVLDPLLTPPDVVLAENAARDRLNGQYLVNAYYQQRGVAIDASKPNPLINHLFGSQLPYQTDNTLRLEVEHGATVQALDRRPVEIPISNRFPERE
jgi:RHS repeat-associated protein